MGNLLQKIKTAIAGEGIKTAGTIFKDLADGIGQFITKPEDRQKALEFIETKRLEAITEQNRHDEVIANASLEVEKELLKDKQDARDMQKAALQQQDKFAKRYVYYLASFIIGLVVLFDFCLLWVHYPPENRDMINQVSGVLNASALIMVLSFFFGSSKSSSDKQEMLLTRMNKE